jgi:hypothetical protein
MSGRVAFTMMMLAMSGLTTAAIGQPLELPSQALKPVSQDVIQFTDWIRASRDNGEMPFIVIDKAAAEVMLFDTEGQFVGSTPALLGSAHGDGTVVGIGDRELSGIGPEQRTTPAGRFVATFGPAKGHDHVLWVDYSSSLAIHPIVPGTKKERRLQRLKSASAEDNRITYGCINISPYFYTNVVRTLFQDSSGLVYILPEERALAEVFPAFGAPRSSRSASLAN